MPLTISRQDSHTRKVTRCNFQNPDVTGYFKCHGKKTLLPKVDKGKKNTDTIKPAENLVAFPDTLLYYSGVVS